MQLVQWTPALQLAVRIYHLPGPALIAPVFVACLLSRPRVSSGLGSRASPGLKGDTISQRSWFSWAKVAPRSLRGPPPLLYETHRRNIASN